MFVTILCHVSAFPMQIVTAVTPIKKQLDKNLRKVQGIPLYIKDEDEFFHNCEIPIIIVHNGTNHFAPCTITNRQKLNNLRIQYLLAHISDAVKLKDSITFKDLPNKNFVNMCSIIWVTS